MTHKELLAEARAQLAYLGDDKHTNALVSQIDEFLAQPEQEPVKYKFSVGCRACGHLESYDMEINPNTPPHRKPLTDEIKDAFFEGFTSVETYNDKRINTVDEAWEQYKAAHGIKE